VKASSACDPSDSPPLIKVGEPLDFAALVRTHQRMVYSLALRMSSNAAAAEDLAQEVFLQLHRCLADIETQAHLRFWLRRVTTNLAIDHLRRQRKYEAAPLDEDVEAEDEAELPDPLLQRQMHALLEELAPQARAVVVLRYQEDMDPLEIAAALSLSPNTVKSHLRRSLQRMRMRLGFAAFEGPDRGVCEA